MYFRLVGQQKKSNMKKSFISLLGHSYEVEFNVHDITKYEHLYHRTLKELRSPIERDGLLRNMPLVKSVVETGLLFFSYPVDQNTSDCFRWQDELCSLVILDAKKLHEDGFVFYDDYWGMKDQSSKRNHLCCDADIPTKYIIKILEFTESDA